MGTTLLSLDYVLLLHGLAWLLLVAPALNYRAVDRRLSWHWMALSAVCKAVQLWAQMLDTDFGHPQGLSILRFVLEAGSVVCLLEFARGRVGNLAGYRLGRWVHGLILGVSCVAAWHGGIPAFAAVASVGWPLAALLAAARFWRFGAVPKKDSRSCFRIAGLALVGCALLSTMVFETGSAGDDGLPWTLAEFVVETLRLTFATIFAIAVVCDFNRRFLRNVFDEHSARPTRRELSWAGSLLAAIIVGWAGTELVGRIRDDQMRNSVLSRMRVAVTVVDTELVASLTADERDLNSPSYAKLKAQMVQLAKSNPDVRFAMLMSVQNDTARFLVDSEEPSSPDYSPPGQPYGEAPDNYISQIVGGVPFVIGPLGDRWGTWVSGSYPLRDFGRDLGWVSLDLDFEASHWYQQILQARTPALLIALLVNILLLTSFRAQWRIRQGVVELSRSNERSKHLVEGSPNCVQLLDSHGRTLAVNTAGIAALGREENDILHHRFLDLWPERGRAVVADAMGRARRGKQTTIEVDYLRPDGRIIVFSVTLSPASISGGVADGLVSIGVDVTARKKYEGELRAAKERAEAADRAKGEFLAVMSHEIRTPLGGVIGTLDLLQKLPLENQQRHYASLAQDNAELLLEILDDILDSSKIDAGKLSLESIPFRLRLELGRVVETMRVRAVDKNIALQWSVDPTVPEFVRGDPVRLRQVLANLLSNAIKFTEAGSVRVEVGSSDAPPNSVGLTLCVRDTGVGMTPEMVSRLFTPFEQADASTTRRFGGTGLGLSITKQLVQLMDGTIEVASVPGSGSAFTVTVRLAACSEQDTAARSTGAPFALAPHSARLHILCAEDEPINRVVAEGLVHRLGHTIRFAEDGIAAIELLAAEQFDLVLMDNRMPRMDGVQATRTIRSSSSNVKNHDIYIIALTANVSSAHRSECLAAGMDDFLLKPLRENDLHAAISRCIAALEARGHTLRKRRPDGAGAPGLTPAELLAMVDAATGAPPGAAAIAPAIAASFLKDAPERLATIRKGVETGNTQMAAIAAHSLKSISHYVNATELSHVCAEMENYADHGQWDRMAALLANAHQQFEAVRERLAELHPPSHP